MGSGNDNDSQNDSDDGQSRGLPRTHSILVELQLQLHFALIMDKQEGVAAKAAGAVAGVCI